MKVLQKILFTFAVVLGLSLGVFAQKDDPKKPRKPTPPVITPAPDKPPPKKDDKPKKSFVEIALITKESFDSVA
jgi:hypothetical protein